MTAREAITLRIRFLRERESRQQSNLLETRSEIAHLIEQRDSLTDADTDKIDALCDSGVLKRHE
jgi:hypothetical protein